MHVKQEIESSDASLKRLITESNYCFYVPNYQRHYVWTEKEISVFLKDGEFCWKKYEVDGEPFPHFAGQMILREICKDRNLYHHMEIVDGQQRLTTFTLVVAAAIRVMQEQGVSEELQNQMKYKYLYVKPENANEKRRLTLSEQDEEIWERLLNFESNQEEIKATIESHKCLQRAEKQIRSYLYSLTEEGKTLVETGRILQSYVDIMAMSFGFVLLMTSKPGYMYALYQIVNDRGIPLTPGELLKARTLELLADKPSLMKRAENMWNDILSDSGSITNRYLTWNYTAIKGKPMESKGALPIHVQYEQDVFFCYNKRILSEKEQNELMEQLEQLHINILYMRNLEKGVIPFAGLNEQTKILFEALIVMLKNANAIPLYLEILDMEERVIKATIENITPMLAKTFFMAKTMCGLHDGSINRCYMEIWKKIERRHADMDAIKSCLKDLLNKDRCGEDFFKKINEDVYAHGSIGGKKAKFLLLMLELDYHQHRGEGKNGSADDSVNILLPQLSIEHILKESVDTSTVSARFYEHRNKIGNLTLIGRGLNSRLKDKDFLDKKEIYQASPYWVTRQVGCLTQWKLADCQARQRELMKEYRRIFTM